MKTFLTALREDFAGHREIAPELESLIARPSQRIEYLRLMAVGLHANGPSVEAADAYLELAELTVTDNPPLDPVQARTVQVDDDLNVRLDRWLQGRLSALFSQGDEAVRQQLTHAIGQRLQLAMQNETLEGLEQFLSCYRFHPLALQARVELAKRYVQKERYLEASMLVSEVAVTAPTPSEIANATAALATEFADANQNEQAASYYRLLQQSWPDLVAHQGQTGGELYAAAQQQPPLQTALNAGGPWLYGRAETSIATRPSSRSFRRVIPIPVVAYTGVGPRDISITYDGGGASTVVVRNAQGELKLRLPLMDGRVYYQHQFGLNYASVFDNLLLMVLGDQVLAIDLHQAHGDHDEAILWREPFARSVRDISIRRNRLGDWPRKNPFVPGEVQVRFVTDSTGMPVGGLGPATSSGLCFLKSRTLLCVEPATGDVLWQRTNLQRGSTIFGDEQHVFVVGREDRQALVLSAVDGHLIGQRAIPDWDHRWTTQGRFVLAWEENEQRNRLFLYDVWQETDVWSEEFSNGSRGCLVGTSQVGVMQPDGRFVVRSLDDDQVLVDTKLLAETNLKEIHVLPSKSQYLLVTNNWSNRAPSRRATYKAVTGGLPAPLIRGRVYALDPDTGEQQWQIPAVIEDFGLPLNQPHELPTLWFIRHVSNTTTRRGPASSDQTSVLCLDRRDGRILFAKDEIPTKTNSYQIEPNHAQQTVKLVLPGRVLQIRFTDEPTPPAPPAQTGNAASLDSGTANNVFTRLGGAIVNTILGEEKP